jgi:hypothetical protein
MYFPAGIARYEKEGGSGLGHKARGRISNRSHNPGVRKYAMELVHSHYSDFGPTLAAEALLDRHSIRVGRETLRRWMMADGIWFSRKQRKQFHQPRLRREKLGELIQIDGSEHRWFEHRGDPCTLLVFIDDATGRLMHLKFALSESTESYFDALRGYDLHLESRLRISPADRHSTPYRGSALPVRISRLRYLWSVRAWADPRSRPISPFKLSQMIRVQSKSKTIGDCFPGRTASVPVDKSGALSAIAYRIS